MMRRPRHATVVAYLALFVALGIGSAYAANELAKNSVSSKTIKNGGVKGKDLAADAVTAEKVADGSLQGADFAAGQLPAGPQGSQGEAGPAGPTASAAVSRDPDPDQNLIGNQTVAAANTSVTTTVPSRIIGTGTVEVQRGIEPQVTSMECRIKIDGAVAGVPMLESLPNTNNSRVIAVTAGASVPAGTHPVALECTTGANGVIILRANLTAIAAGV